MRKVLLLISYILFIINIDSCYYFMATTKLLLEQKILVREWQWLAIGFYSFSLQALVYNCKMTTRTERLMLLQCTSVLYYTIAIIVLTLHGLILKPYVLIISYNYLVFILLILTVIVSFYGNTFNIGFKLVSRKRK